MTNTNDAPSLGEELRTAGDRYWGKPKERAAFECGATWGFHKGQESAALTTAAAAVPPEGWVMVPVDPTEEMITTGLKEIESLYGRYARAKRCWQTMIAAAPKAMPVPAGGDASPTAASIAWTALRDLTDPLGEAGVKIMGHVRIYAQRQYEAGLTEGRATPPAQAADSVLEDAARWQALPAFFEEYQIDAMKLYRDIDAAIAARKQGANHD